MNFLFDYKVPGGYTNNVKGCQMTRLIDRDGGKTFACDVRHPSTAAAAQHNSKSVVCALLYEVAPLSLVFTLTFSLSHLTSFNVIISPRNFIVK